jgi:phage-related protein
MATFTVVPSYASRLAQEPRVLRTNYGDGYEARVADGINNDLQSWSLTFVGKTADMTTIVAFFRTEGGVTNFDWTPPNESAGKYVVASWSRAYNGFDNETVSAVFQQVNE